MVHEIHENLQGSELQIIESAALRFNVVQCDAFNHALTGFLAHAA